MTQRKRVRHVAFISTRIAGTDGVSLETKKWADVLRRMGMECSFIAGECDEPANRTRVIEEAHFNHPEIRAINKEAFGQQIRTAALTQRIVAMTAHLREQLSAAIDDLQPDVLIIENALTIPMNVPLGLALIQIVQQTDIQCILHHHDFIWERERFYLNSIDDFLAAAFPPSFDHLQHVVINNQAAREFSRRTGLSCHVIPNVMDFDHPPDPPDEFGASFRSEIGVAPDDIILLQPTRVVPRKAIERSIELARRLGDPRVKLVISHDTGDEGEEYLAYLTEYAELLGVPMLLAAPHIGDSRMTLADGRLQFSIGDAYPQADIVTYPSQYEGFGNAFLEAVYHRRPIVSNRYAIYRTDLEPTGLRPITFDGFLSDRTVAEVRRALTDEAFRHAMTEHNYEVGRLYFSYDVVEQQLRAILHQLETRLSRRSHRGRTAPT